MKKVLSILLIISLLVAGLTACAGEDTAQGPQTTINTQPQTPATTPAPTQPAASGSTEKEPEEDEYVVDMSIIHGFGGGSSGGGYYTISNVLSQYFTEQGFGTFTAQPTTGGGQNGLLMQAGELDIAVINGADCLGAYTGTREGFSSPYDNIRAIGILYSGCIQIAVKDDDSINNFVDLKGKKFGVGNTGSGDNGHVLRILDALDMTIDDINAQYIGVNESSDQLRDGQIDGFFNSGSVPYSVITELVMAGKAKVIGFTQEQADALCAGDSSVYFQTVIPAGSYDNQTEDLITVAIPTVLCVDAERIDDEVAYMITKAIYEDPAMSELYAGFDIDAQTSIDGIKIPFHDGAIKYYKEIGLMK